MGAQVIDHPLNRCEKQLSLRFREPFPIAPETRVSFVGWHQRAFVEG